MEDNIASVSDYFHKNCIYMYAKGLNFTYSPKMKKGESILHHIRTSCIYPTGDGQLAKEIEYLQDFVGLHCDVLSKSDLSNIELLHFIKASLKAEIPLGIFLDTYDTPWHNKFYRKFHSPHSFLVADINDTEEYVVCIDGVLSKAPVVLPFVNLFLYTSIMTFNPIPPRLQTSLYHIVLQIVDGLKENHKLDHCDSIRLFSQDIKELYFTEEEKKEYKDLNASQFVFGLKSIEYGRKNLAEMFRYLAGQFQDQKEWLFSISSKISSIAKSWELVLVFFIRGFYCDLTSYYMNKASELLMLIAKEEEDIAHSLLDLLGLLHGF